MWRPGTCRVRSRAVRRSSGPAGALRGDRARRRGAARVRRDRGGRRVVPRGSRRRARGRGAAGAAWPATRSTTTAAVTTSTTTDRRSWSTSSARCAHAGVVRLPRRRARRRRDPRRGRRRGRTPTWPASTSPPGWPTAPASRCPGWASRLRRSIRARSPAAAIPADAGRLRPGTGGGLIDVNTASADELEALARHRADAGRRDRRRARSATVRSTASTTSTACPASVTASLGQTPRPRDGLNARARPAARVRRTARRHPRGRTRGAAPRRRRARARCRGAARGRGSCPDRAGSCSRWSGSRCSAAPQTQRALDGQVRSSLAGAIAHRQHVTLAAVLVDDPEPGRFDTDVLVRVAAGSTHRTLLAVATGDDALRLRVLEAGDRVVLDGRLGAAASRPVRRPSPLAARGRPARRRAGARPAARPRGVRRRRTRLRAVVLRGTAPLPPTPRALLAGFLLGDTRADPGRRRRPTIGTPGSRTCSRCRARTSRSCSRCSARCSAGLGLGARTVAALADRAACSRR